MVETTVCVAIYDFMRPSFAVWPCIGALWRLVMITRVSRRSQRSSNW